jgi:hypothetical protein
VIEVGGGFVAHATRVSHFPLRLMSPEPSVQNYWKQLQESYSNNVHDVHTVQSILIDQILPAMKSELGLDQTTFEESKHWLEDTC